MGTYVSWNGTCLPADHPLILPDNRSYLAGEGAFETMRAHDGRVIALSWHLERLHATLDWLGWPERLSVDQVQTTARDLLGRQGLAAARVRLTVSRGSDRPMDWLLQASPHQGPTDAQRQQGVDVITVDDVPHPRLPHKLTSRIAYVQVDRRAREAGVYEGLFCEDGVWLEGSRTNLVALQGDRLIVGDARIVLPGIARRAVKAGATRVGLQLIHTGIDRWATRGYDGLFVTNSLIGVLPVRQIDGEPVAVPREGLARLQEAYRLGMATAAG